VEYFFRPRFEDGKLLRAEFGKADPNDARFAAYDPPAWDPLLDEDDGGDEGEDSSKM
jgi:hypothetical protein